MGSLGWLVNLLMGQFRDSLLRGPAALAGLRSWAFNEKGRVGGVVLLHLGRLLGVLDISGARR